MCSRRTRHCFDTGVCLAFYRSSSSSAVQRHLAALASLDIDTLLMPPAMQGCSWRCLPQASARHHKVQACSSRSHRRQ
ncbi:hypothetical protein BDW22DRAFT_988841 [Trametopsis cervina]|nr:hypothetical protein BDW22DRAFT_988841 [Trametopsis cervina]